MSTSLFQANSEWPTSGYSLLERGVLFDLGFYSTPLVRKKLQVFFRYEFTEVLFPSQLKHQLQWEGCIRDLNALSKTTSFDVRKESGLSLKSAFKHILSVDLRDDLIFPSSGALFQMTSELAGAGGNVGYLRNDFFLQGNYSILKDAVSNHYIS